MSFDFQCPKFNHILQHLTVKKNVSTRKLKKIFRVNTTKIKHYSSFYCSTCFSDCFTINSTTFYSVIQAKNLEVPLDCFHFSSYWRGSPSARRLSFISKFVSNIPNCTHLHWYHSSLLIITFHLHLYNCPIACLPVSSLFCCIEWSPISTECEYTSHPIKSLFNGFPCF